jgi:hypothetical protein
VLRFLLACALVALTVGCGPGVGGTGTGYASDGLNAYGAAAASVCSSDFAGLLACPPASGTTGPGSVGPAVGTVRVHFSGTFEGRRVEVVIEDNRIELSLPCEGLRFVGVWGAQGQLGLRFYGSFVDASASQQLASLLVQVSAGTLVVRVLDLDSQLLLGPLGLLRLATPPPASCP